MKLRAHGENQLPPSLETLQDQCYRDLGVLAYAGALCVLLSSAWLSFGDRSLSRLILLGAALFGGAAVKLYRTTLKPLAHPEMEPDASSFERLAAQPREDGPGERIGRPEAAGMVPEQPPSEVLRSAAFPVVLPVERHV